MNCKISDFYFVAPTLPSCCHCSSLVSLAYHCPGFLAPVHRCIPPVCTSAGSLFAPVLRKSTCNTTKSSFTQAAKHVRSMPQTSTVFSPRTPPPLSPASRPSIPSSNHLSHLYFSMTMYLSVNNIIY